MLKTIQLPPSNYLITYYQAIYEVIWLLRQKTEKTNVFKKRKYCKFYQSFFKNRTVKLLRQSIENINHAVPFSDRGKDFLALENGQISNGDQQMPEELLSNDSRGNLIQGV